MYFRLFFPSKLPSVSRFASLLNLWSDYRFLVIVVAAADIAQRLTSWHEVCFLQSKDQLHDANDNLMYVCCSEGAKHS
ncbi:hypothetical protein Plhal304r1_c032g0102931 [Plasmopara halstedii]